MKHRILPALALLLATIFWPCVAAAQHSRPTASPGYSTIGLQRGLRRIYRDLRQQKPQRNRRPRPRFLSPSARFAPRSGGTLPTMPSTMVPACRAERCPGRALWLDFLLGLSPSPLWRLSLRARGDELRRRLTTSTTTPTWLPQPTSTPQGQASTSTSAPTSRSRSMASTRYGGMGRQSRERSIRPSGPLQPRLSHWLARNAVDRIRNPRVVILAQPESLYLPLPVFSPQNPH